MPLVALGSHLEALGFDWLVFLFRMKAEIVQHNHMQQPARNETVRGHLHATQSHYAGTPSVGENCMRDTEHWLEAGIVSVFSQLC